MTVLRFLGGDKQSQVARARRRMYPIHFYVGRNGAGKSLAAVYDTMPDLDAGLPCLSTVRLLDFRNPRPCDDPNCKDLEHVRGHQAVHPLYGSFHRLASAAGVASWRARRFRHGDYGRDYRRR